MSAIGSKSALVAGVEAATREAGGMMEVAVIRPSDVPVLLGEALAGSEDATLLLRLYMDTAARIDEAPAGKRLDRTGRASVVLLGDDDYASTGPAGWVATRKLLYWTRAALVHGTGGTAEDYSGAVAMAIQWDRLVLVETSSDHLMSWADAVQNAPHRIAAVFKRPTAPGVHPLHLKKGEVQ